ncbi:MAG: hypothetical protein ACK4ON_02680 [Bacteroidia bacterium]
MNKLTGFLTAFFYVISSAVFAQSFTWSTLGNNDITPDNWFGTGNTSMLKDIIIKTDNKERMRLKGGGFLGIGLTNPNNIVHIHNPKNTPTIQEMVNDTRLGGGLPASTNSESPYFGSTGLQISNVESGTGINDGLHIGLRNGMVQGVRLNAIFNLKENADMQFFTNNSHRMTIDRNGNIGIGTPTPQATMHLKKGANTILFERQGYATFVIQQSAGNGLSITRNNASTPDFYIANNGNVGIGLVGAPHKLTVKGTVKACRMEVEIDSWCDEVFEENYKLRSIKETDEYIKANKHLPDMPSEKELLENNIDVAQMLKLQQRKIEELMLYIIELEKKIGNK